MIRQALYRYLVAWWWLRTSKAATPHHSLTKQHPPYSKARYSNALTKQSENLDPSSPHVFPRPGKHEKNIWLHGLELVHTPPTLFIAYNMGLAIYSIEPHSPAKHPSTRHTALVQATKSGNKEQASMLRVRLHYSKPQ